MAMRDDAVSVGRIVEWALKGLIVLLLTIVGFFMREAYFTLAKTGETLTAFQRDILAEVQGISGTIKVTIKELSAHEDADRQLRQADSETMHSFERRLLTIERGNSKSGVLLPLPNIPEDLRSGSRSN